MDRDRPPFGSTDEPDGPRSSGGSRRGRDDEKRPLRLGDREPRPETPSRLSARDPESGSEAPRRGFESLGRFSRDQTETRREPTFGSGRDRDAEPSGERVEPRLTGLGTRQSDDRGDSFETRPSLTRDREERSQPPLRGRDRETEDPDAPRPRNRFLSGERSARERPPFEVRSSSLERESSRPRTTIGERPMTTPRPVPESRAETEPRSPVPPRRERSERPQRPVRSWREELASKSLDLDLDLDGGADDVAPEPDPAPPAEPAPRRRERPTVDENRERYSMRLPERLAGRRSESVVEPPAREPRAPEPRAPEPPAPQPELPLEAATVAEEPVAPAPEVERPARPKRDWRSMRFSSRFAQPPQAYDLDEVGDQRLSFEPQPEPEPAAAYEPPYEPAPPAEPYAEEAADPALRRRYARASQAEPQPKEAPYEAERGATGYAEDVAAPREDDYQAEESYAQDAYEPRYEEPVDYDADAGHGADVYEEPEPAAPPRRDTYRLPTMDEPEPEPEYAEPAAPPRAAAPVIPGAEQGRRSRPRPEPRAQVVYDDFEPADGEQAPADIAYVDENFDDFGDHSAAGAPLRAEPRPEFEPDTAQFRGSFDDYEKKSRKGPVLLLVALGGVAVVAGGLIFGYQMLTSGGDGQVPLVKLEETPSKVAPEEPGGMKIPHQNKLIYDRIVGEETTVDEKVVAREEPVIDLNAQDDTAVQGGNTGTGEELPQPPAMNLDSGAQDTTGRDEAVEIMNGGTPVDSAPPVQSFGTTAPPPLTPPSLDNAPEPVAPPSGVETVTAPESPSSTRQPPPIPKIKPAIPPEPVRTEVASRTTTDAGGPIQLAPQTGSSGAPAASPSTSVQSAPLAPPTAIAPPPLPEPVTTPSQTQPQQIARTQPPAASAPAPARATSGGYVIQTAAFRSEEEAQEEYRKLREKHSRLLAGYGPLIQKADLGSRGIYYRLRLGPLDSKASADSLCDSLLAAGEKDCLVRRR